MKKTTKENKKNIFKSIWNNDNFITLLQCIIFAFVLDFFILLLILMIILINRNYDIDTIVKITTSIKDILLVVISLTTIHLSHKYQIATLSHNETMKKIEFEKEENSLLKKEQRENLSKYLGSIELLLSNYNEKNFLEYKLNYQKFKIYTNNSQKALKQMKCIDEILEKRNPYAHDDIEKMKEICDPEIYYLLCELNNESTKN